MKSRPSTRAGHHDDAISARTGPSSNERVASFAGRSAAVSSASSAAACATNPATAGAFGVHPREGNLASFATVADARVTARGATVAREPPLAPAHPPITAHTEQDTRPTHRRRALTSERYTFALALGRSLCVGPVPYLCSFASCFSVSSKNTLEPFT